jgi:hypothetical protein
VENGQVSKHGLYTVQEWNVQITITNDEPFADSLRSYRFIEFLVLIDTFREYEKREIRREREKRLIFYLPFKKARLYHFSHTL